MIGNITPNLPEKLVGYLRPGAPALLLSAGADGYATSAYTWALALDAKFQDEARFLKSWFDKPLMTGAGMRLTTRPKRKTPRMMSMTPASKPANQMAGSPERTARAMSTADIAPVGPEIR